MLHQLPEIATPRWLTDLSSNTIINQPFPLHELLLDSLYYPSSGFDGDPVRHLAGNILSFIYVDYGHSRDEFMNALRDPGFRGYDLFATRSVTERELTPHGWRPTPPTRLDGEPSRYRAWIKKPFCSWTLFQRREDIPVSHGPSRFSLLYLCADGVAAYQALYVANSAIPKAVAVIQPGHAFGGNWTNYTKPNRIFAKTVLGNPSGQPEILLYGGMGRRHFYREPCWPDYQTQVCLVDKTGGGSIGVWSKNAQECVPADAERKKQKRSFKIISGGQTGVERAALDVALTLGIPCGGWYPKGRKAEVGPIPDRFPLKETDEIGKNIKDSDGTLILTWGKSTGKKYGDTDQGI